MPSIRKRSMIKALAVVAIATVIILIIVFVATNTNGMSNVSIRHKKDMIDKYSWAQATSDKCYLCGGYH